VKGHLVPGHVGLTGESGNHWNQVILTSFGRTEVRGKKIRGEGKKAGLPSLRSSRNRGYKTTYGGSRQRTEVMRIIL